MQCVHNAQLSTAASKELSKILIEMRRRNVGETKRNRGTRDRGTAAGERNRGGGM